MTTEDFKKISNSLPTDPGIYQFMDKEDTILYIGKAKNLKKRLQSYFGDKKGRAYKTKALVKNSDKIQFTLVETEADALLLENTLIKKYLPRYNVQLKDAKSYTYVCVKKERFPRVFFTRKVIRDGSKYFGPYTSKARMKVILDLIRTLFPLRTCSLNLSEQNIAREKFKVCLEYHIENCQGPCVAKESEEEYNEKIDQVMNILKGQFKPVKDHIKLQMSKYAESLEFEKAMKWKIRLEAFEDYQAKSTVVSNRVFDYDVFTIAEDEKYAFINYIKVVNGAIINSFTQEVLKNMEDDSSRILRHGILYLRDKFHSVSKEILTNLAVALPDPDLNVFVPQRGDKYKLIQLSEKNVDFFKKRRRAEELSHQKRQTSSERILKTLQEDLNMSEVPFHIECFDNSNIQGTNPSASCVVFKNAKPSKKDYRHFKIKTVIGPDDFASMTEVVYRRYSRLVNEKKNLPQLVIIDGGKGQLSSAMKSIKKLGLENTITVIGIAKKLEEIFFPGDPIPLYINKKSESLKLIQQARNEAHRFAVRLHRKLRSKDFTSSELQDINGIGEKTSNDLLKAFGSVQAIRNSRYTDLEAQIGASKAKLVYKYFQEEE